jgi:hypothetical protein
MGWLDKLKQSLQKAKVATSVGKVIMTGKASKTLEKVDNASDIAIKTLEMLELAKELIKK